MKDFTFVSVKSFFISVKFGFDLIDLLFYLLQNLSITNLTIQTILIPFNSISFTHNVFNKHIFYIQRHDVS